MTKKSILEEALLQVQTLEEAVRANAKGILASTMKQELNDLLKEQEDEDPDKEEDVTDVKSDDETPMGDDETVSDEIPTEDEPAEPSIDDELGDDTEMDDLSDEDPDEVLDMTNATEDEVLKVFKAMKPEDGIVVKKDGNKIELSDEDNDYIIKLGDDETLDTPEIPDESTEFPEGLDENEDITSEKDEIVYEIELDEEDDEKECKECGDKKIEATEAARTKWNQHGNKGGSKKEPFPKKVFQAGSATINEEILTLKKQNGEYKKALILFKEKLNEVAVFNANLAFATRLFTEHSTTKQEKLDILKRFDSISTITESKNLYNNVKGELGNKKPITKTLADKIVSTPKTSSSEVLSESKAYENPQFKRMKELMNKINN